MAESSRIQDINDRFVGSISRYIPTLTSGLGVDGSAVPKFCQLDGMAARLDAAAVAFLTDPHSWVQGKYTSPFNQDGVRHASACAMGAIQSPKRLGINLKDLAPTAHKVTKKDLQWAESPIIGMNDSTGNTAKNVARNLKRLAAALRLLATDPDGTLPNIKDPWSYYPRTSARRMLAWNRAVKAAFADSRSTNQVQRQSIKRVQNADKGKAVRPITAKGRKHKVSKPKVKVAA